MMKIFFIGVFSLLYISVFAQQTKSAQKIPLIHSHNDYEKPEPLFNALRFKAFTIEADVFLVNGELMVAHEEKDIRQERSLVALYLDPIDSLFRHYGGRVSDDKNYQPTFAVDIKSHGKEAIAVLVKLLSHRKQAFDRMTNKSALQVIISGDRGPVEDWSSYPSFIGFDGRPSENYDDRTLAKVITISDSYAKYYKDGKADVLELEKMISKSHAKNKLVRIWGAPDFPATWKLFSEIGIDIINTDKIQQVREYFMTAQ